MTFKCLNIKSPLCLFFVTIITFFLLDNLIFRTKLYVYYLSDDIGTTAPLKIKYTLEHESKDKPNILIPSASLLRQDFRLSDFEKKNPNAPFTVLPLVISGTGAYTQYYLLKKLDPTHKKYRAIILPQESYKILASFDVRDDTKYQEARRIITFTPPQEWPALLEEYKGTDTYKKLLNICLFANRAYLDDLETFIPSRRLKQNLRTDDENYHRFYQGSSATNTATGLELNPNNEIINCPLSDMRHRMQKLCTDSHKALKGDLSPEKTSRQVLEYQKKWLTKILDLYKDSPTQIVFIQMPHAFLYQNRVPLPDAPDLRDILPKRSNIHFLEEHYFDALNKFEYMKDDEHLNQKGSEIFTNRLTPILYEIAANHPLPESVKK